MAPSAQPGRVPRQVGGAVRSHDDVAVPAEHHRHRRRPVQLLRQPGDDAILEPVQQTRPAGAPLAVDRETVLPRAFTTCSALSTQVPSGPVPSIRNAPLTRSTARTLRLRMKLDAEGIGHGRSQGPASASQSIASSAVWKTAGETRAGLKKWAMSRSAQRE